MTILRSFSINDECYPNEPCLLIMSTTSPGYIAVELHAVDTDDHSITNTNCPKHTQLAGQLTNYGVYDKRAVQLANIVKANGSRTPEDDSDRSISDKSKVDQWLDYSCYYHLVPLAVAEDLSEQNNGLSEIEDDTALMEYGGVESAQCTSQNTLPSISDEEHETEFSVSDTSLGAGPVVRRNGAPQDGKSHGKRIVTTVPEDRYSSSVNSSVDNKKEQPNPFQYAWSASLLEKKIYSSDDLIRIIHEQDSSSQEGSLGFNINTLDIANLDFIDFAEHFFNEHESSGSVVSAISKKVRSRRSKGTVPMSELTTYTKHSTMSTSLVRMLNPENSVLACAIFKDICKYMRGELKTAETVTSTIQNIIAQGIDQIELRDELYCQLMRQSTNNPCTDASIRVWHILGMCSVAFFPSKTLMPYLLNHCTKHCNLCEHPAVAKNAEYCLERLQQTRRKSRVLPPTALEIETVINITTMDYDIYFLDGSCVNLKTYPDCTVKQVLRMVQERIGLKNIVGWSLYECTQGFDKHVQQDEYLADIMAKWEQRQMEELQLKLESPKRLRSTELSPKKTHSKLTRKEHVGRFHSLRTKIMLGEEMPPVTKFGKLVFCKRMFQPLADICSDPVELHLLYCQFKHFNVQLDEYSVSHKMALQLASLQAQVEHGDYQEGFDSRYSYLEYFLCSRIIRNHSNENLAKVIAEFHKNFASGCSTAEAKGKYLKTLSYSPLFGCTKMFAHYRGIWSYGAETILAVDRTGIKFISLREKLISNHFYFSEIEAVILEERNEEYYIIIQLCSGYFPSSQQKCFLFECLDLEDFASCIEFYSPAHATWLTSAQNWRHRKFHTPDDWLKMSDKILGCRRLLIKNNIIKMCDKGSAGLFSRSKNILFRGSSSRDSQNVPGNDNQTEPSSSDIQSSFWSFTKVPFKTSLLKFQSNEMIDVSVRMFNTSLVYTGLETAEILEDMDLVVVVQTLIVKCMEHEDLCNEFYLQLIKQTTDAQNETTERVVLRYWHLMTMATCVMVPPNPVIYNYLLLHLKRYAIHMHTEEGCYALFCIKSLFRTQDSGGRKYPPSFKEIEFVTRRHAIEARVTMPDGRQMLVEFDSASTSTEVMELIKAKSGMRLKATGFGLYLDFGVRECYIQPTDKLADSFHQWEKFAKNSSSKEFKFIFKKRLFLKPYYCDTDPVEVELLYHQSVSDLFDMKIHLTRQDATTLCAIRAQIEFGNANLPSDNDYSSVIRILPRHLRSLMRFDDIRHVHQSISFSSLTSAHIAFISILQKWAMYGASVFEVTQSHIEAIPKILWLAVNESGVSLIEKKGQVIYFTYTFAEISDLSPGYSDLSVVIGTGSDSPSLVFVTQEATEIVQLIHDYQQVIKDKALETPLSPDIQKPVCTKSNSVDVYGTSTPISRMKRKSRSERDVEFLVTTTSQKLSLVPVQAEMNV